MAHPRIQFALLSTILSALAWVALTPSLTGEGLPPNWPAGYPAWWYDANDPQNGLIDATRPELNQQNHAVLNQGQLWNLAAQGIEELNTQLMPIGGAGFGLTDLQEPGASPAYYAPANIGQLKHTASHFYDRFAAVGFGPGSPGWPAGMALDPATGYPWANNVTPDNFRPANLGQAKHLWSWDLALWTAADDDADDLPDWWERYWYDTTSGMPTDNADSDGLSDLVEYLRASDPLDADANADGLPDGLSVSGEVVMERWWIDPHAFREIGYIEGAQAAVPRTAVRLSQLSWDAGPVNYPGSFGHRIRGYLIAPATADYRFRVYGDDFVEFWLSPDAASTGARRIAFNTAWNFRGAFGQHPGQSSLPQALQAGQRYYFEVYHYGDRISDYFGIGWQYDDMLEPELIPGHSLESFGVDPADLDGDALDDAAELAAGLDPRAGFGSMGRFGDPDADGFSNHWELLQGFDPLLASTFPARTRAELFPGLTGADALGLDSWQLDLRGYHQQYDAFESDDAVFLVSGGLDVGQYAYAYRTAADSDRPFRITARVRYHAIEDTWAEAGLMLRAALDSAAAFYRLSLVPDGRVVSWARHAAMAPEPADNRNLREPSDSAAGPAADVWLRLLWDGETVTADYSYDGQAWLAHGQARIDLGTNPYFGFATTAYDALETVAAGFSDYRIEWDSDADGLWDDEELALGTDPNLADTDGDGLSDYEESVHTGTDPLLADHLQYSEPLLTLAGQAAVPLQGNWRVEGDSLYALDYRGTLEFSLNFAAAGFYRLDVSLREASNYRDSSQFELNGRLGSVSLGSRIAVASSDESATLSFWLPWRAAGSETLILDWVNIDTGASLQVDRIELVQLIFPTEAEQNQWIANQIAGEFGLDSGASTGGGAGAVSITSPWSLSGRALDLDLIHITADSTTAAITAERALRATFHANVPLKPSLQHTEVAVSYASGLGSATESVQWALTNLAEPAASPLPIRIGDSLLLACQDAYGIGVPSGAYVEVFMIDDLDAALPGTDARQLFYSLSAAPENGGDSAALGDFLEQGYDQPLDALEVVIHTHADGVARPFINDPRTYLPMAATEEPVRQVDAFGLQSGEVARLKLASYGTYALRCAWRDAGGSALESVLLLRVPEVDLGGSLSVTQGYTRDWVPDALPEGAIVETDPDVVLSEYLQGQPRRFALMTQSTTRSQLLARLAPGGAVADVTTLHPLVNYSTSLAGGLKVLDTFADGTQMVEFTLAFGGELVEDFNVVILPFKAGVTFADGTLVRTITAEDLDELGRYRYQMLLPPDVPGSACHYYQMRQGDLPINFKI